MDDGGDHDTDNTYEQKSQSPVYEIEAKRAEVLVVSNDATKYPNEDANDDEEKPDDEN